ncbi:MAG: ribonuclease Z [Clostridia bacterium]|nr:ribonuclease Z [Clostridia bacterium]
MKLIFCVDKKNGIMFFGKRQSTDGLLREWIIAHTQDSKLWMSNYSAEQFSDLSGYIADDNYINKAGTDDYCFIEDKGYNLESVNEIILCRWNRQYQADKFFDIDLKANGFKKESSEDIIGSSHEKITIDIYKRG